MPRQIIENTFMLLPQSLKLVFKHLPLFLLVSILPIASGLAILIKDISVNNDQQSFVDKIAGPGIGSGSELGNTLGANVIVVALLIVFAIILFAMQTALELKASKGKQFSLNEIIDDGLRYAFPLFIQSILTTLIIVVGLVLLIVPGIIAYTRLVYAPYTLVNGKLGVIESIKASNNLAKANPSKTWSAVGLYMLLAFIAVLATSIPRTGELLGTLLLLFTSLIISLRYIQLTK